MLVLTLDHSECHRQDFKITSLINFSPASIFFFDLDEPTLMRVAITPKF